MIIAAITRPTGGQLVVTTEAHPRTGATIIVLAHVHADESTAHRTALMPAELPQVIAALQIAAQKLKASNKTQHRTISVDEQIAEDSRLF